MSAFETVFGLAGKDWAIVVADAHMQSHQIIAIKQDEDKITEVEPKLLFGCNGASADRSTFMEYVQKSLNLYGLRNGVNLSPQAAANWTRNEMADALRRGPYQVDLLIAGFDDATGEASLYFLDMYSSMAKVNKAAHSYAGNFVLGLLDKEWKEGLSEKEGLAIVKKAIAEIRLRFALGRLDRFTIKVVNKDGFRTVNQDDL